MIDDQAPWRNPRVVLLLALVFLCGGIAGMLVGRSFPHRQTLGSYWREGGREISLQKLKKELDLTPDQAQQIEVVLDDFVKYYHALQAQMDGVRMSGKERITSVLTPEQRQKFDKMMYELQNKQLR